MEYKTNMNREKTTAGAMVRKVAAKVAVPLSVFYLAIGAPGCERNSAKTLDDGSKGNHELYIPYSVTKKEKADSTAALQNRDSEKTIGKMMEALETPINTGKKKAGTENKAASPAANHSYELYVPYSRSNPEIDRMVEALKMPLNSETKK
ncbi:Uncharacterised protein [uncultured archaeon]|nr:Uncharacterised protein [uncultured archaeon]